MDLIREMLLQIEAGDTYFTTLSDSVAEAMGITNEEPLSEADAHDLEHHLWLLRDGDFVIFEAMDRGWQAIHITWKGHDFLDSVRDPAIWQQTKEGASKAGGFTFEILGALTKGLIKEKVKKHTGVELEFG